MSSQSGSASFNRAETKFPSVSNRLVGDVTGDRRGLRVTLWRLRRTLRRYGVVGTIREAVRLLRTRGAGDDARRRSLTRPAPRHRHRGDRAAGCPPDRESQSRSRRALPTERSRRLSLTRRGASGRSEGLRVRGSRVGQGPRPPAGLGVPVPARRGRRVRAGAERDRRAERRTLRRRPPPLRQRPHGHPRRR